MTRMNSRPVSITQVYPQDTEPTDTRDGILWVDTSVSPPNTYTYDADTASWEPVATQNVYVQDTAPSGPTNGEIWVDTSVTPPSASVYDATNGVWVNQVDQGDLDSHAATAGAHHSRPVAGSGLADNAGTFDVAFATESGSISSGNTGAWATSVSLTNTYDPDSFIAVAQVTIGSVDWYAGSGVKSHDTDANGNVTGITIEGSDERSNTCYWYVVGVPV